MSYFNMSKSELADCAARGDSAARQELARRRIKNNPNVVDAPAKAPKPKMNWEAFAARAAANKAARRAKWSPEKQERMKRVQRVMNFAQHLIRENNWYPQAALRIAWDAEKKGHLSDYTLRAKGVVPADVIARLQKQSLDPEFRKRGQPMQEEARMAANPAKRGRGARRQSVESDYDFDYSYGL